MSEDLKNNIRLSKAAKEFNIGMSTIIEFLGKKGYKLDTSPNTKLNGEMYALLVKEYQGEKEVKKNADQLGDFSYKGKSITVESTIKNDDTAEDSEDDEITIRYNGSITEEKQKKAPVTEKTVDKVDKKEEKTQEEAKPKVEAKVEKVEEAPKTEAVETKEEKNIVDTAKENKTAEIESKEIAAKPEVKANAAFRLSFLEIVVAEI